jgi:LCP family protein required for cell wall assembly
MDRFSIKRPGIQKSSQTNINTFANTNSAAEANNSVREYVDSVDSSQKTALLARRTPIDMSLPGEFSPARIEVFIKQNKWRRVRKVAVGATATMVVLSMTLGGLLLSQNYLRLHKVFRGTAPTADALKPNQTPLNLLNGQSTGRVNVLLLGRDGVAGYNNPNNTNTMMVASIDTINNNVSLISLPSNLWVNVPNMGVMKLSTVMQTGESQYLNQNKGAASDKVQAAGDKIVDSSVEQILGTKINYNVVVNLQAVAQMVNSVGGITVNVPTTITDPSMAWQNGGNPVIAQAGTQSMNGNQALLYIMSKETTSDFARDTRQRQVLTALFDKITSLPTYENPTVLNSLLSSFGDNVSTDLSLSDAGKLYKILSKVSSTSVTSLDMTDAPNQLIVIGNETGMSVDLPQAGLFNYSAIKKYVSSQLKNPYVIKENAKILVLNGTNVPGLATSTSISLRNSQFNVLGAANAPKSNYSNTEVIQLNKSDKYTAKILSQKFKAKLTNKLPNKSIPTDGADFVIILGNNEANTSQTQAN